MASSQTLHDLAVRHRVGLGRYSTALTHSVIALLNRVDADIVSRLSRADFGERQHSEAELNALLREVRQMQALGWVETGELLTGHLDDLTGAELDFAEQLVGLGAQQVGVELQAMRLTPEMAVAAVKARPFSGRLLSEWLADTEEAAARRVRDAIRMGWFEGQSIPEIVRRVRGTRAQRYTDGVLEINRRAAESMVRTAVTHVSSVAAQEVYDQHADIIEGIEWVATLDSRTSKTCAGLDGQVFPLDKGPRPPAHVSCRSTTIPRLKGMESFERTTFADWLAGQGEEAQDDILGPSRAKLWRSGALRLDQFVDNRGEVLTLDELRAKDAAAFRAAGL